MRIHHGTVSACIVRTNAQIKTDSFCRHGRNCRYFFAFSFVKHIHLSEKSFPNFPNHLSSAIVLCSPAPSQSCINAEFGNPAKLFGAPTAGFLPLDVLRYCKSAYVSVHAGNNNIRTPYFCFRFSFYSLLLFVYFNYAAEFGNACLYGLRSDFGLMFRVQPFRKPNDMLIQCKNRTFSFIIGLCSVIHAVKQEHRPVEFKRKLHRLRIG